MLERPIKIIDHREQVFHQTRKGVFEEVLLLALGALAEILEVGERPHVAIFEIDVLRWSGSRHRGLQGAGTTPILDGVGPSLGSTLHLAPLISNPPARLFN